MRIRNDSCFFKLKSPLIDLSIVAHEGLVAIRALVLAATAGAVALNRKERVKQPGLVHASERLVFQQKVHGKATTAEVVREELNAAAEPALVCILVASQTRV